MHKSSLIRYRRGRHGTARRAGPAGLRLAFAAALTVNLFAWSAGALAQVTLDKVGYSSLPGNRVQIQLDLSAAIEDPLTFAIDHPARVALDFPGVSLNLDRRTQEIGVGMARSVTAVEAAGRTRVVLNLVKLVPYELQVAGNSVFITLEGADAAGAAKFEARGEAAGEKGSIENVDFRRGEEGQGRVIVTLSDPSTVVNTFEEGNRIIIDFMNANLPERLERRLDVVDFATPVQTIDTLTKGNNVRMEIESGGLFEHLAYQSDDLFTLEVKPVSEEEEQEAKRDKFGFTGERLSLNFQNIEVRAVLQLIADFTGFNLVASDTVSGNVTLRLKNVPWDQALDIILKSRGLAMRQAGNVIMVAPSEEIAARERLELEAQQQVVELAPLRSEFIQVNYASANDLAGLLRAEENSMMSERGNVTVDARTNTLLVRDTAEALDSVRQLVAQLDVPVRQVLIESRIVVADDTFNKALGVKFGVGVTDFGGGTPINTHSLTVGGGLPGDTDFTGVGGPVSFNDGTNDNFIVDLPIGGPAGSIKAALIAIPDVLLQLELQALQAEGRGEVLSSPRVITSNQTEAVIEDGTQIPFQEASSSGATSTSFQPAVLSLRVTPQITPDDRVIMDLNVSQDSVGATVNGVPSIDTQSVQTQVLVDNGNTIVLGGIFSQTKRKDIEKVPFFGDLPYFGFLFRNSTVRDDKRELLIFVTPKILSDAVSGGSVGAGG